MSIFIKLTVISSIITLINGCCDYHVTEGTCYAETGLDCVWLQAEDPRILETTSKTQQCVSPDNAECLQALSDNPGQPRTEVCPPPPGKEPVPPGPPLPPGPVEEPLGPECAFEECTNSKKKNKYNIQFVLDESSTVGLENYRKTIDFVYRLIKIDLHEQAKVSVYSFSNDVDKIWSFKDSQTRIYLGVLDALMAEKKKTSFQGKCKDTLSALETSVRDFMCKSVKTDDINYLILITDGDPYCGCKGMKISGCSPKVCGADGKTLRKKLKEYNIRILTMAVGDSELKKIQCLSDDNDVFQVDEFTDDEFYRLEEGVRPILCEAVPMDFGDILFAVLSNPVQSFNELSLLIKSIMITSIVIMFYGIYKYYENRKYSGYKQLKPIEQYGSIGDV